MDSALTCSHCAVPLPKASLGCKSCGTEIASIAGVAVYSGGYPALFSQMYHDIERKALEVRDGAEHVVALAQKRHLPSVTQERLAAQADAEHRRWSALSELLLPALEPWAHAAQTVQVSPGDTLLPIGWSIDTMLPWIWRDWADSSEIEEAAALCGRAIDEHFDQRSGRSIAFPGCGAGGLAYRLAHGFEAAFAFDLDLPTLALADWMKSAGRIHPAFDLSDQTEPGAIGVGSDSRQRPDTSRHLQFLLMDALNTGFAKSSLDCVVTSFLLDVLPDPMPLFEEISRILRPGGLWVNYGPSGPAGGVLQFTPDEVSALAAPYGFELSDSASHRVTFLAPPSGGQHLSWCLHSCYLTALKRLAQPSRVMPSASAPSLAGSSITEATRLAHQRGAVIQQGLPIGPNGSLVYRHHGVPGRPEHFAVGPSLAAILSLIDGVSDVAGLCTLLMQRGLAKTKADARQTLEMLVNEGLIIAEDGPNTNCEVE